ncbi:MAG: Na/Pi symporter, partial [Kiritimatiellia bacterium]|nr:Na/Pi symporter [Kiritimatiellia bacterium]
MIRTANRVILSGMSLSNGLFSIFALLGGLALFLYGMDRMAQGLRGAAGGQLRAMLGATTHRRDTGFLLGLLMGTLAHSSAATVMLVGLVNAGLLTLGQALAPVVGASVGTTVSMQLLSFRLDAYAFAILAAGFLWSLIAPGERARHAGRALFGFGLLFLGMRTMSGAVQPHRELLAPLLARVDG